MIGMNDDELFSWFSEVATELAAAQRQPVSKIALAQIRSGIALAMPELGALDTANRLEAEAVHLREIVKCYPELFAE